jgi:eukaryotic-like serine/threonine-protein kinase
LLSVGARLGPYEITGAIGAGGMGEVYQARDTRLDRTVAIKVLLPEVSGDPQRRARFEREARALASLSHPHICPLFDVGEHEGSAFLVMEHLLGETLSERLARGPLPLPQALEMAVQLAEGLDAAHKRGIVHRDLKPGNIMLTKTGAKVLDFGLAKLRAGGELDRNASTDTAPITRVGAVMGTLQYMAPEQLENREVDARADLWALGAILYEMVSGARPFQGDSAASLTAAILERDPAPLSPALTNVPQSLDRLIRRCLAKRPDDRWESAHDLADELRWIAQDLARGEPQATPAPPRPLWRRALPVSAVAVAGLFAGIAVMSILRPATQAERHRVVRSLLDVRPATGVNPGEYTATPGGSSTALSWTPDGQVLVFVGYRKGDKSVQLFVRTLDSTDARPLAGTEGAQAPVVSADGKWVAFWADDAIKKVPLAVGPVTVLAEHVALFPERMDWGDSGLLVFRGAGDAIWRVRAGGKPEPATTLRTGELQHLSPHLLPGDKVVLFTVRRRSVTWGDEELVAQDLASGKRTVLVTNATDARYLPPGRLLFMRQGTLIGVPFDPVRLEMKGEQVALLDGVAQALTAGASECVTGAGQFAASSAGDLAYLASPVAPPAESRLVTVDRTGRVEPLPSPVRAYQLPVHISPDGRQLAVGITGMTQEGVWIYDLTRQTLTPLEPPGSEFGWPRWTPDGQRVAFDSLQSGIFTLAWQRADGSGPSELLAREGVVPSAWSPDGRELAVVKDDAIWVLDLKVDPPKLRPVVQSPEGVGWPAFSPDGRWLLYASSPANLTGSQVYLQPYPGPGPRLQVSVEWGANPAWNPNGREIFFTAYGGTKGYRMMSVGVSLGSTATLGTPRQLFEYTPTIDLNMDCTPATCYSVASDGQRFFATQPATTARKPPVTHINLVLNWRAELEAKVPSGL